MSKAVRWIVVRHRYDADEISRRYRFRSRILAGLWAAVTGREILSVTVRTEPFAAPHRRSGHIGPEFGFGGDD